jgi:O-antigen ligase
VSALLSENRSRGLRDWQEYWLLVIYVLAGFTIATVTLRKIVFWVLFASASLSALVALAQAGGGIDILFLDINDKFRPSSTLFTMTFAGIFYQLICVNISLLLRETKCGKTFFILLAGLTVQIGAFLFNFTRGAWIALFVGLVVVAVIQRKGKAFAAVAAVILLSALFSLLNPTLNSRVHSVVENVHAPQDRSIKTRQVLWDISIDLIREHPLLGAGMGDFSDEAQRRLEGRFVKTTSDAHNVYLHILATRGLLGFIPFLLFWIVLAWQLLALERRLRAPSDSFDRHLVLGTVAATAAILVGALTENNIDDSEVFISFLFLAGIALSAQWRNTPPTGKQ